MIKRPTPVLAGVDAVYAAAFRRAGLLRVFDLDELFAAAETLGRLSPLRAIASPS
jgi:acetyltransferase